MKRLIVYGAAVGLLFVGMWLALRQPFPSFTPPPMPHRDSVTARLPHIPIRDQDAPRDVPILMYHYIRICDDPEDKNCPSLSVSKEVLTQQMQWMKDHGYVTVDLEYFMRPYKIQGKPFVITLDDGYADTYTDGLPVFERFGFTATWYIITDRVGTDGYLTWSQVRDIHRRGMTIGSHTVSHQDVTTLKENELRHEIAVSRQVLASHLNGPVTDFCYPYGRHNMVAEDMVAKSGYITATTTAEGIAQRGSNLMILPRVRMKELTDLGKALRPTTTGSPAAPSSVR